MEERGTGRGVRAAAGGSIRGACGAGSGRGAGRRWSGVAGLRRGGVTGWGECASRVVTNGARAVLASAAVGGGTGASLLVAFVVTWPATSQ